MQLTPRWCREQVAGTEQGKQKRQSCANQQKEVGTKKTAGKKIHLVELGGKRKMVTREEKRDIQGGVCKPCACLYKQDLYLTLFFLSVCQRKRIQILPKKGK